MMEDKHSPKDAGPDGAAVLRRAIALVPAFPPHPRGDGEAAASAWVRRDTEVFNLSSQY